MRNFDRILKTIIAAFESLTRGGPIAWITLVSIAALALAGFALHEIVQVVGQLAK